MDDIELEQMGPEWKALREILNRWDPIGVFEFESVEWSSDEYDAYIPRLLHQLRTGKSIEQIVEFLETVAAGCGSEVPREKTLQCAEAAFNWCHRRSIQ